MNRSEYLSTNYLMIEMAVNGQYLLGGYISTSTTMFMLCIITNIGAGAFS